MKNPLDLGVDSKVYPGTVAQLKVSELADEVGITADAVRYYERIGLLPEPRRSTSGYRLYDADAVRRVRFIKRAQRFGLRLADIGGLIAVQDQGMCPCGCTRGLLEVRMGELDEEMAALSQLRNDIRTMLDEPSEPGENDAVCGPLCGTTQVALRETATPPETARPLRLLATNHPHKDKEHV